MWVNCVNPNPPQWGSPEDLASSIPIRCKMGRVAPSHLKLFAVALFFVSDLGDAAAQLAELNAMSLTRPPNSKGQVAALNQ